MAAGGTAFAVLAGLGGSAAWQAALIELLYAELGFLMQNVAVVAGP